jgi:hypothetical protein
MHLVSSRFVFTPRFDEERIFVNGPTLAFRTSVHKAGMLARPDILGSHYGQIDHLLV